MHNIRRNFIAASLAAVTFAVAVPIFADDVGRVPSSNRLDFLAGYLSLTDSQKSQAKTIFDAATTAASTAQGQLTAAHDALTVAVKANRADSELDRLASAVGVIHGQLEAIHAKAMAKFYALLTAEQKTKFDALGNRRAEVQAGAARASRLLTGQVSSPPRANLQACPFFSARLRPAP